jgi:uncharacterized protein (TIGR02246 family)
MTEDSSCETTEVSAFDEQAIAALYRELMGAWNRGSAEDFASAMTPEMEFIGFDGTWFHGKEEVAAAHQSLFDNHLKGTRLAGDVVRIRLIARDVALIHARGNTVMRGKSAPAPARDSLQTLVAVRQQGIWRLAAFQNTRIRLMGRNFPSILLWLIGDKLWNLVLRSGSVNDPDWVRP